MKLFQLLALSTVVMCLSHTIARERIFLPLRNRLGGMDTWFGYLVSCPYCVSHWLAFALVPATESYFIAVTPDLAGAGVLSWFLSSILVVALAAFLRVGFYFIDETQKLAKKEKEIAAESLEAQHK